MAHHVQHRQHPGRVIQLIPPPPPGTLDLDQVGGTVVAVGHPPTVRTPQRDDPLTVPAHVQSRATLMDQRHQRAVGVLEPDPGARPVLRRHQQTLGVELPPAPTEPLQRQPRLAGHDQTLDTDHPPVPGPVSHNGHDCPLPVRALPVRTVRCRPQPRRRPRRPTHPERAHPIRTTVVGPGESQRTQQPTELEIGLDLHEVAARGVHRIVGIPTRRRRTPDNRVVERDRLATPTQTGGPQPRRDHRVRQTHHPA